MYSYSAILTFSVLISKTSADCVRAACSSLPDRASIARIKTQPYASCVRSLSQRGQQHGDCVNTAISRVTEQRKCLCAHTPINRLLSGLILAKQLKTGAPIMCTSLQALQQSTTCPQRVKECVQTAISLHSSVSMLRGSEHHGQCSARQRQQKETLTSCLEDAKHLDLAGCGVWKRPIQMFTPFVRLMLPLICTGCDIHALVHQCMAPPGGRPRQPRAPPRPCQQKAQTEHIVGCLLSKMAASPTCRGSAGVARQGWNRFREFGYFRVMDQACRVQTRYERVSAILNCPTLTSHPGRGKRDTENQDEYDNYLDPLKIMMSLFV